MSSYKQSYAEYKRWCNSAQELGDWKEAFTNISTHHKKCRDGRERHAHKYFKDNDPGHKFQIDNEDSIVNHCRERIGSLTVKIYDMEQKRLSRAKEQIDTQIEDLRHDPSKSWEDIDEVEELAKEFAKEFAPEARGGTRSNKNDKRSRTRSLKRSNDRDDMKFLDQQIALSAKESKGAGEAGTSDKITPENLALKFPEAILVFFFNLFTPEPTSMNRILDIGPDKMTANMKKIVAANSLQLKNALLPSFTLLWQKIRKQSVATVLKRISFEPSLFLKVKENYEKKFDATRDKIKIAFNRNITKDMFMGDNINISKDYSIALSSLVIFTLYYYAFLHDEAWGKLDYNIDTELKRFTNNQNQFFELFIYAHEFLVPIMREVYTELNPK
jgi:hypothetical protein